MKKIVNKLKTRNWWQLNVSHFTRSIRDTIWNWKKIPKVIVDEIIHDLENWERSNWAWAIWILLVSWNEDIKKYLKKALLDDKKFSAKSVLALLNTTKILSTDEDFLFKITEETKWNQFSITVNYLWNKLFKTSINFWKYEEKDAIWIVRNKTLKKILIHFVW